MVRIQFQIIPDQPTNNCVLISQQTAGSIDHFGYGDHVFFLSYDYISYSEIKTHNFLVSMQTYNR